MSLRDLIYNTVSAHDAKANKIHSCGCVGPKNGEPLCPCQMRGVEVRNGRYVKILDYGPVPGKTNDFD